MKVYVVVFDWNKGTNCPGNDAAVCAVKSTKELAEAFIRTQDLPEHHDIEEWDVDA